MLTKGSDFKTRKLGPDKIELRSIPVAGVNEKPYQCENRMGMCEALSVAFTKKLARIEHPVCYHKGGDCCVYILTWEKTHVPALEKDPQLQLCRCCRHAAGRRPSFPPDLG